MKRFITGFFAALAISALLSITALAGDKGKSEKKHVYFTEDVMVNGTLLKAGDYDVQFNQATGELSIIRDGKVKAKTSAHIETRSDKAKNTAVRISDKGGSAAELVSVTFGGTNKDVIIGASGSTSGSQ